MKTIGDFIQRLQKDPEFENKAQAFENSDEFMEFVKREGYNFTLDELLHEFQQEQDLPNQPGDRPPAAMKTAEEFVQRLEDDAEFENQARAFHNDDTFMKFIKREGYDFTLDQLTNRFKHEMEMVKPQAEKPPTPLKVVAPPRLRRPDGIEFKREADPSPQGAARSQNRPEASCPKYEGVGGGRHRGMKWRNADT